jgi:acyl dehydratase
MAEPAAGLKEATYENVEIPEALGPVEVLVDDFKVRKFAFTQDDHHPWFFGPDNPWGRRVGHAALLANDLLNVFYSKYDRNTIVGLHTQEELWFGRPAFVGERVTISGTYVEKYVKRGQGYVVMEAQGIGEDGQTLLRHRGVEIMRTQPGDVIGGERAKEPERRVTGEVRDDVPEAAEVRPGLPERTAVAPLVKRIHQEQMSVFSGIGEYQRSIHSSLDLARESGLRAPIMQGQQQACFAAELMSRFFGAPWFTSGHLQLKFVHPIYVGDTVTMRAAVLGEIGDGRLELEVWGENQDGVKTGVGWASALAA